MADTHPKAKLKPLGQRPEPRPRIVIMPRQQTESSSTLSLDRDKKTNELSIQYPIFREDLNEVLARATHSKLPAVQVKPKNRFVDEGVSERLAAVTEVKKSMVLGTDQIPHEFAEGYKESHFKFLKMNLDEHQSGLDKAIRQADSKPDWHKAVTRFLDLARSVQPIENPKASKVATRQRRGGIMKHRSAAEFNPRAAWKAAITRVISVLQNIQEEVAIETTGIEKSLVSQLKDFQSKTDSQTLTKLQSTLSIPSKDRTDRDIQFLNRLLFTRLSSFAKYTADQRVQLCRVMRFESHRKGAVIISQGHKPGSFYFLFSGQCEVMKARTDERPGSIRVHVLNSGDSFGAVAMETLESENRSASVVTTVSSAFLVLDQEEYRLIASGQDSKDQIAFRVSLLKNITLFANADQEILEGLALKTRVKYSEQNSTILKENESSSRIYFITSGVVHLSKSLKLVKTITTKETQYQPYDPSKPLKLGESIVTEEVNYRTLFAGQFFPELECPDVFKDDLDAYLKPKLISRLAYREPRGLNHSYAQATCATQVGCIDIPKLDFAKMATTVMIKAALSESRLVWVPMSELKGQWVLQREWDEYKKRITQDARVKKAARKWIEAKEIAEFTAHHFAYDLKPGV